MAASLPPSPDDDDAFRDDDLAPADDDDVLGGDLPGLLDAAVVGAAADAAPTVARRRRCFDDDTLLAYVGLPEGDEGGAGDGVPAAADDAPPPMDYPEPPLRSETVADLLARVPGGEFADPGDAAGVAVSGVDDDAACAQPGDLFVCALTGPALEAALADAAAAGAVAALVSEPVPNAPLPLAFSAAPATLGGAAAHALYGHPTAALATVLYVGGPGKTTAAWLTRGVLEEAGCLTGMLGSLEYALHADRLDGTGAPWVPTEADPTLDRDCSTAFHVAPHLGKYPQPARVTSAVRLARVAAGCADRGAGAAVLELSAAAVAAGAALGASIDVAVFVGSPLADDGTPDSAGLEAIASLFGTLSDPDGQRAVINADDAAAPAIAAAASRVPAVTYALYNRGADVFCAKARFSLWETELLVRTPVGELSIASPLVCRHNAYNVVAAVAAGLAVAPGGSSLDLKTIVRGVEATEVVPGRCEAVDEGQPFAVVVDAARTPDALGRLLDGVREAGARRVILVVGAPGERHRALRPFLGEVAHYKADVVILTNDNPRGEAPHEVVADIVSGFPDSVLADNAAAAYPPGFLQDPGRVDEAALEFLWAAAREHGRHVCEDRWMAIRWAVGTAAAPDDVVLLVGKGADDYQEYVDADGRPLKGWFDDRVEARNALARAVDLWGVAALDRSELPWAEWEEREPRLGTV